MKLALAQIAMADDMASNYEKALKYIKEAADGGADLVFFPEVQLTKFFPQYEGRDVSDYVVTYDHPYVQGVCAACRENGIYASPNFYVEENGKRYDMSLLIDDEGNILGNQKMVHIAQCEQFYEQDYYTASEEGYNIFDTKFGKIGVVVCFDRHYPESVRTEALRGAELILIPTANTTSEPKELFRWEVAIQAFQSSVNIAMCNRVGVEDDMEFSGDSIVTDYNGTVTALAGDGEELLFAAVDLPAATEARNRKPYTQLRNTALYE